MNLKNNNNFLLRSKNYLNDLYNLFNEDIYLKIEHLAQNLQKVWQKGNNVFICGNGGSACNAMLIANDLHYGTGACGLPPKIKGLKVEALPSNSGIITCLANDIGYEDIYSHQLENKGNNGDILIALSGSGNSPNIIKVLKTASAKSVTSYAILGFKGGESLNFADYPIHFPIDDMQICEDTQLIVGHICMQWLSENKPDFEN